MRLRHVTGSSEQIQNNPYVIHDYEFKKKKFSTCFPHPERLLYVEIGTGKGNFIIENAKQYPNINFIGIEKYDSVLVRALEKLENIELPNLKFIRMDATNIDQIFEKEIDRIYLNFSDPWPKNRHEKRRLSSPSFLEKYDVIFKGKKQIIMKTDNRKLFEYSIKSFTDAHYQIEKISLNLYEDDVKENIPTEYEMKFHQLGYPIYFIEVIK